MRLFYKIKNLFNNTSPDIKNLESRLQYKFNKIYYLEKALTHRSVQHHLLGNYERLEFIGDAVIDQTVSLWLFKRYPDSDEGILTKKRSNLVNRQFLSTIGNKLDLMKIAKVDPSVNIKDPKVTSKITADIYEAIVGAIYLDGGYKYASKFINRTLCKSEDLSLEDHNYKGQLIEYCHKHSLPTPQFNVIESKGPEHEKIFFINVIISPNHNWNGVGSTKKSAEQDGAQNAINALLGS